MILKHKNTSHRSYYVEILPRKAKNDNILLISTCLLKSIAVSHSCSCGEQTKGRIGGTMKLSGQTARRYTGKKA